MRSTLVTFGDERKFGSQAKPRTPVGTHTYDNSPNLAYDEERDAALIKKGESIFNCDIIERDIVITTPMIDNKFQ